MKRYDLQQLIGTTLRWGVTLACIVALAGGLLYMIRHGAEPAPDYGTFDASHPAYTSLGGIWQGLLHGEAFGIIQTGAIILILTPIVRVVLSFFDFVQERDWLYAAITAAVLAIILFNSLASPT